MRSRFGAEISLLQPPGNWSKELAAFRDEIVDWSPCFAVKWRKFPASSLGAGNLTHEHTYDMTESCTIHVFLGAATFPKRAYIRAARRRSALAITLTELSAIAAAAMMGLSRTPNTG